MARYVLVHRDRITAVAWILNVDTTVSIRDQWGALHDGLCRHPQRGMYPSIYSLDSAAGSSSYQVSHNKSIVAVHI